MDIYNIREINSEHNIYIVSVTNGSSTIIKLGYSSNIIQRIISYYYHNPFVRLIGTYYVENAAEFEKRIHYNFKSYILDEWYDASMLNVFKQYLCGDIDWRELDDCMCVENRKSLSAIYTLYLESNDKQQYLIEYPEFEDYEKYLTVKNMNSLRWNKDRINKSVADLKALDVVHRKVSFELDNGFISLAALKALYQKILSELSINIAGKAVMIEDNRFVNAVKKSSWIKGKTFNGYEIQKNMFQINMN